MANPNTAKFPTSVATDTDLLVAGDRETATLAGAIGSTDLTILTSTQNFIAPCVISIEDELILISVAASTVLTVAAGGRGFDGTTPASHAQGKPVNVNIIRWSHNQMAAEVKAIEGFLGTNGTNIGQSGVYSQLFNWSQTPGGSLGVGSNVVTLVPVPPGISGAAINTYVRISGGAGAAESCLITGGTAVAGNSSGTIIFSCANTHTGAWSIGTATAGIKEALNTIPTDGGRVWLPAGPLNIYATIILGAGTPTAKSEVNSMSLVGQGAGRGQDTAFPADGATTLLWGGATGGTMMKVAGPVGNGTLSDFMLDGQDSAAIGLDIVHSYSFCYRKLTIVGWTSIGLRAVALDFNFSGMVTGCNNNLFDTVISSAGFGDATAVGAQFGQAVPNTLGGIYDFASNMIYNCVFRSDVGTGTELRFCDNNSFYQTATGKLKFTKVLDGFPGANVFYQCPQGTVSATAGFDLTATNLNIFFPFSSTDTGQDPLTVIRYASGFTLDGKWFGIQRAQPLYYTTVNSSSAIANTASQTAFDRSYLLPAYMLNYRGAQLRIAASGRLSTTGSPALTLRVKFGALEIGRFPYVTFANSNFQPFQMNVSATAVTTGASNAFLMGACWSNIGGGNGRTSEVTGLQAFNSTIDNTITVTAQWGTASASNSIILDNLSVDVVYPGSVQ